MSELELSKIAATHSGKLVYYHRLNVVHTSAQFSTFEDAQSYVRDARTKVDLICPSYGINTDNNNKMNASFAMRVL